MGRLKKPAVVAIAAAAIAIVGASSASATTLEVGGVTRNEAITFTASLKAGTSLVTKARGEEEFVLATCTGSHLRGQTTNPYSNTTVKGPLTELTFSNCPRLVTVHNPGTLEIHYIPGEHTNGTVYWEHTTVTIRVPILGYVLCPPAETTHVGTLTGVSSGQATLHISAGINCSYFGSITWEATYLVTTPDGLGLSA
ncbi:MAG TPA: hypothetical protein VFM51_00345 [Solirubrobacterales bacterium]|nr:hypothetical protein [Solirubrobacterales bacterium]